MSYMTQEPGGRVIPEWTIGDRLRKARSLTGLSIDAFARQVGVSPKTISNAENEAHGVRKIVLNAWALATGVHVQWLETGTAPESAPDDDGPGPSLPRLDSNQQPFDYRFPQVRGLGRLVAA